MHSRDPFTHQATASSSTRDIVPETIVGPGRKPFTGPTSRSGSVMSCGRIQVLRCIRQSLVAIRDCQEVVGNTTTVPTPWVPKKRTLIALFLNYWNRRGFQDLSRGLYTIKRSPFGLYISNRQAGPVLIPFEMGVPLQTLIFPAEKDSVTVLMTGAKPFSNLNKSQHANRHATWIPRLLMLS